MRYVVVAKTLKVYRSMTQAYPKRFQWLRWATGLDETLMTRFGTYVAKKIGSDAIVSFDKHFDN